MSLLARLATKIGALNSELTATEALGLLLVDPAAARVLTSAISVGAVQMPTPIRYTTQAGDSDGRPDIIGSDGNREVLHLEGKFWAGLTEKQANGDYLNRLRRLHGQRALHEPYVGALIFVTPPRRSATLMDELAKLYNLSEPSAVGNWLFGQTSDGMTVGVTTWEEILTHIAAVSDRQVAEDARQLLDLVQQVDSQSFVPWTTEQRTDQETPRRILQLAALVETLHKRLLSNGIATSGNRYTITQGGPLAFGKRIHLGQGIVTLRVSLSLWKKHGQSPLWLTFGSGAAAARRAFPHDIVEIHKGAALPLPLPVGRLEHEILDELAVWIQEAGCLLNTALVADTVTPSVDEDEIDEGEDV